MTKVGLYWILEKEAGEWRGGGKRKMLEKERDLL